MNQYKKNNFQISNEPIKSKKDDVLGFHSLVKGILDKINSIPLHSPYSILLEGEWGSGKSSCLNLLEEAIYKQNDKNLFLNSVDENYLFLQVVRFNPWNIKDKESIILSFFNTLENSFKWATTKKILKKTVDFSMGFFSDLTDSIILSRIFKAYKKAYLNSKKDIFKQKEKLANRLERSKIKYIVFIDDLDRLDFDELNIILQMIASVCVLPNIIFSTA